VANEGSSYTFWILWTHNQGQPEWNVSLAGYYSQKENGEAQEWASNKS